MKYGSALALGLTLATLPGGAFAQNATQNAPAAPVQPAGEPAAAPARFQTPPLGKGPWDVQTEQVNLNIELVTDQLDRPWGLALLPNGDMLVTERPGRLRVLRGGVLDPQPIGGLPPIFAFGISGLTDIVLHPDFANNGVLYLAYSKAHPDAGEKPTAQSDSALAVLRAKWDGGTTLTEVQEIFVASPWYGARAVERCCGQGPTFGSYGGRMAFGADGKLYITSGDRNYGELVQDRSTHFGKIIRLNDDGSVPQDNPFVGQEGWQPEIWSTGHRNPTGLSLDPATGTLWETEFGPRGGDELNRIERGANYGWMDVTQGKHYDGTPAKGVTGVSGMTDPVIAWLPDSHNPGNVAVYHGAAFPQWDGDLLVAMMDRSLIRAELGSDGQVIKQEVLLKDLGQRFRDVRVGPDGEIYLLTDENEGALLKITAKP
jgi:glucose/arabinose dehydrogenase